MPPPEHETTTNGKATHDDEHKHPVVIGVDPGLDGALVVYDLDLRLIVEFALMPLLKGKKRCVDYHHVRLLVRHWYLKYDLRALALERASAHKGSLAARAAGFIEGVIDSVCDILAIPLFLPSPQLWKAIELRDTPKDKVAAIRACQQRQPHIDLIPDKRRKPHDGLAEAFLIASWCSKQLIRVKVSEIHHG